MPLLFELENNDDDVNLGIEIDIFKIKKKLKKKY